MKTKHTQGPWYAVEYAGMFDIQNDQYIGGDNLFDADSVGYEVAEANAKLAAAAPEMFEFISLIGNKSDVTPEYMIMKRNEIIKKATE